MSGEWGSGVTTQARKWFTVALLILMVFLSFMNLLAAVLLNDMIVHYSLEDAAKGYNSTAISAGGMMALFVSFFMMGRISKKLLLPIASAIGVVAMVLMKASSNSFPLYLACCVVFGVSTSAMDTLLSSNMADLYQGKEAEKKMGLLHTTYSISSVLVPTAYMALLSRLKTVGSLWNDLYLIVAGLGAVSLIPYMLTYPRKSGVTKDTLPPAKDEKITGALIRKKMTQSMLPGLMIAMLLHALFFSGFSIWISRYFKVVLDSKLGDIALSLMWLGIMVSRMTVPLMPFSQRQYLKVAGFVTAALLILGILVANPVVMCFFSLLIGTVFGSMLTTLIHLSCTTTPENTMLGTTAMGISMSIAGLVSSPIIGTLESVLGLRTGIALLAVPIILTSTVICLMVSQEENESF